MRWALVVDGRLVEGEGRPNGVKLGALARDATAGVFNVPAGPSIYVAGGPDLLWTIERAAAGGAVVDEFWGIAVRDGSRVWVSSRGMIGIGRAVEDVEAAHAALVEAKRRG